MVQRWLGFVCGVFCTLIVAGSALGTGGMLAPAQAASGDVDLATLVKRTGNFQQFLLAAKQTELDEELSGEGPWTIFAPTDEAFGKLPEGLWFKLLQPENKDLLRKIVRFHMVPGEYPPQRLLEASAKRYTIPGAGGPLLIDISKGSIAINDTTQAEETFFAASNGLVQVVGAVLVPSKLKAQLDKL